MWRALPPFYSLKQCSVEQVFLREQLVFKNIIFEFALLSLKKYSKHTHSAHVN